MRHTKKLMDILHRNAFISHKIFVTSRIAHSQLFYILNGIRVSGILY